MVVVFVVYDFEHTVEVDFGVFSGFGVEVVAFCGDGFCVGHHGIYGVVFVDVVGEVSEVGECAHSGVVDFFDEFCEDVGV